MDTPPWIEIGLAVRVELPAGPSLEKKQNHRRLPGHRGLGVGEPDALGGRPFGPGVAGYRTDCGRMSRLPQLRPGDFGSEPDTARGRPSRRRPRAGPGSEPSRVQSPVGQGLLRGDASGQSVVRGGSRGLSGLDRGRRALGPSDRVRIADKAQRLQLVVLPALTQASAAVAGNHTGALAVLAHRPVRLRPAEGRGSGAQSTGRPPDAHSPGQLRSHRAAAQFRGHHHFPRRLLSGGIREADRSAACFSPLR